MKTSCWMISVVNPRSMYLTRPAMLALFVLALTSWLPACSREPAVQVLPFEGAIMGTRYHVTVVAGGEQQIDSGLLGQQIDDALSAVDNAMTTYRDSELMQLNAAAVEQWVPVSPALFDVLQVSSDIHAMTDGAFDPTVGRLVRLWGFGVDDVQGRPEPAVIEAALANTGLQYLEMDGDHQRVRKLRDIELDLSAVAKGYAVDRVALLLEQQGISRYLVEVGGEVRVAGLSARGDA
ncbi:MAG: FAD:protein FMN transferase, partial [Gammaproteobacteria bacterium]